MKRIVPIIALLLIMPSAVFAHSGGTDSSGGHHDYNNVSGLGSYHYHHGMGPHLHEGGVCPYDTPVETVTESYTEQEQTSEETNASDYSSEEETFTMTESELDDYVRERIEKNPAMYGVASQKKYTALKKEYSLYKDNVKHTLWIGIGIAVLIGCVACYCVYCYYRGAYKKGYDIGYQNASRLLQSSSSKPLSTHKTRKVIYCSISFGGMMRYYYRTDDATIKAGDTVIVPAGTDNSEAEAKVISVNEYSVDKTPYPIEKTKYIIRKV